MPIYHYSLALDQKLHQRLNLFLDVTRFVFLSNFIEAISHRTTESNTLQGYVCWGHTYDPNIRHISDGKREGLLRIKFYYKWITGVTYIPYLKISSNNRRYLQLFEDIFKRLKYLFNYLKIPSNNWIHIPIIEYMLKRYSIYNKLNFM